MNVCLTHIAVATGIAAGFSFLIAIALSFGLAFEDVVVPVACVGLFSSLPLWLGGADKNGNEHADAPVKSNCDRRS